MPEVNTRFEQLLHGDVSQLTSSSVCILRVGFTFRVSSFEPAVCDIISDLLETRNWKPETALPDCHSRPRARGTGRIEHLFSVSTFVFQDSGLAGNPKLET
jgi:hypothetical protein